MPRSAPDDIGGKNVAAALDVIAWSEIGPRLLKVSDDGYNVIVTSTAENPILFDDYARHPNQLMTFRDKSGKEGRSTAAGRYQTLHKYAVAYMGSLKLPDFGPKSQDKIAVQMFKEQGGFALFQKGMFYDAIVKIKNIWASMPGAGYDQHEQKIESLAAAYRMAGGQMFKQ